MYKYIKKQMMLPHEFFLPFGGKLNPNNRWCKLASLIPYYFFKEHFWPLKFACYI